MAKRFEATATGLIDGYDYRVEIYDARYGGSSIEGTLQDEENWIVWNAGEVDSDGTLAIKPHEVQLSVIETTDIAPLRSAAEDDIRIEVYYDGSGNIAYKGFLAPNNITTYPLGLQPDVVTLSGTEGIPLLQKKTVGDLSWSSDDSVPIMTAIRTILNEVYPTSIPIEVGMDWWPAGGSLTSSDLPLQERDLPVDGLRESRTDGDWLSLDQALKQLLGVFDLSIQQTRRASEIRWWISAWDAYKSDGHIDTWLIQPDGTTSFEGDQDVVVDLDALDDHQIEGGSERPQNDPGAQGRRRQSVTVTYDHPQVENFLQKPGFEDVTTEWAIGNPDIRAVIKDHSIFSDKTPDETANNQKVGLLDYDSDGSVTGDREFGFEQGLVFHVRPEADAGLRLEWNGYQHKFISPEVRIKNGSTYWQTTTSDLRSGSLPGEVSLPIQSLSAPIGKGVKVPIWNNDKNQLLSRITLSERAEEGDQSLVGELEKEVPSDAVVFYVEPTTTTGKSIPAQNFVAEDSREQWGKRRIYIPYQTPSGDRVSKNTLKIELGIFMFTSGQGRIRWLFDDVRLQPVKGGQPLNETVSEASAGEIGRAEELSQRFGSGPDRNSISRIKNGFRWGVGGPDPTDNWPISELRARQRLRYFRKQNDAFEASVLVENKSPQIVGHEIVKLNGDLHRVMAAQSQPSEGRIGLSLLHHKNYGTS
jgi:hypothetical protein